MEAGDERSCCERNECENFHFVSEVNSNDHLEILRDVDEIFSEELPQDSLVIPQNFTSVDTSHDSQQNDQSDNLNRIPTDIIHENPPIMEQMPIIQERNEDASAFKKIYLLFPLILPLSSLLFVAFPFFLGKVFLLNPRIKENLLTFIYTKSISGAIANPTLFGLLDSKISHFSSKSPLYVEHFKFNGSYYHYLGAQTSELVVPPRHIDLVLNIMDVERKVLPIFLGYVISGFILLLVGILGLAYKRYLVRFFKVVCFAAKSTLKSLSFGLWVTIIDLFVFPIFIGLLISIKLSYFLSSSNNIFLMLFQWNQKLFHDSMDGDPSPIIQIAEYGDIFPLMADIVASLAPFLIYFAWLAVGILFSSGLRKFWSDFASPVNSLIFPLPSWFSPSTLLVMSEDYSHSSSFGEISWLMLRKFLCNMLFVVILIYSPMHLSKYICFWIPLPPIFGQMDGVYSPAAFENQYTDKILFSFFSSRDKIKSLGSTLIHVVNSIPVLGSMIFQVPSFRMTQSQSSDVNPDTWSNLSLELMDRIVLRLLVSVVYVMLEGIFSWSAWMSGLEEAWAPPQFGETRSWITWWKGSNSIGAYLWIRRVFFSRSRNASNPLQHRNSNLTDSSMIDHDLSARLENENTSNNDIVVNEYEDDLILGSLDHVCRLLTFSLVSIISTSFVWTLFVYGSWTVGIWGRFLLGYSNRLDRIALDVGVISLSGFLYTLYYFYREFEKSPFLASSLSLIAQWAHGVLKWILLLVVVFSWLPVWIGVILIQHIHLPWSPIDKVFHMSKAHAWLTGSILFLNILM